MKRKIFTTLAATAVLSCTVITASAKAPWSFADRFCIGASRPCFELQAPVLPEPELSEAMSRQEQEAASLINRVRAEHGLQPLAVDASVSAKARIKSQDMKENHYFHHNSPTYGTPFQMMKQLGITYRSAAENIAKGYTDADAVVSAWMASPGHRANILSSSYSTLGIGYTDGYWTQWFIG